MKDKLITSYLRERSFCAVKKRSFASKPYFNKILVANRGEIAIRVMKTAKRLGIKTVAVFSDVDRHADHVAYADEAYSLGSTTSAESYLQIQRLWKLSRPQVPTRSTQVMAFFLKTQSFQSACKTTILSL